MTTHHGRLNRLVLLGVLVLGVTATAAEGRGRMGGPDPLGVGDPAFASRLVSVDGKGEFDLAVSDGRPVAFVFGSYT